MLPSPGEKKKLGRKILKENLAVILKVIINIAKCICQRFELRTKEKTKNTGQQDT